MRHQTRNAIRILVWVDDPENLHLRLFGHPLLPTSHEAWQPRLLLETAEPGPLVPATLETRREVLGRVQHTGLRPYSMRFDLPAGTESMTCFKLIEDSFPGHKVPLCVPIEDYTPGGAGVEVGGASGRSMVCESLAPSGRYSATAPALWTAIGPPRHSGSTRNWRMYYSQIAIRTAHFLSYHIALGTSGVLMYTDRVARHYLRRHPAVAPYLRSGHLRLVSWDMPERAHKSDEPPGRGAAAPQQGGRALGYNYDQALFASHALLGLSACGANLMLLVSDLSDYLHVPSGRQPWPAPLATCFEREPTSRSGVRRPGIPVAAHTVPRQAIGSSRVPPEQEPLMWASPAAHATARGAQPRSVVNAAAAAGTETAAQAQAQLGGGSAGRGGGVGAGWAVRVLGRGGGGGGPQRRGEAGGRRRLSEAAGAAKAGALAARAGGLEQSWVAVTMREHPLALYDRRAPRGEQAAPLHGRMMVLPAAEMVAFLAYEGVPRHGSCEVVRPDCLVVLHVANYWRPRPNVTVARASPAGPRARSGPGGDARPTVASQQPQRFGWEGSPLQQWLDEGAKAFDRGVAGA